MEIQYDPATWFSSRFAIYNLWTLIKKEGYSIKSSRKYQKEREAWIVGVVLLGVRKIYGDIWWLKIPQDDPPDLLAMTITPDKNKNQNIQNNREVEVMEFNNYSKGTLIEEIIKKLRNKFENTTFTSRVS